jgi:hypothetical protein
VGAPVLDRRAETRAAGAPERHTVASDDQLVEDLRAGLVAPDDPDPVAALLAAWRLDVLAER